MRTGKELQGGDMLYIPVLCWAEGDRGPVSVAASPRVVVICSKKRACASLLSSSSFNLMADPRPPHSVASHESDGYNDPFADRPGRTRFVEPEIPRSPSLRAYDSVTNLQSEGQYEDDEYIEKQPLTQPHGFYPPR